MRPIRTISVFPTLLTLGNLICGFFAIVVAARIDKPESDQPRAKSRRRRKLEESGWLIFLAMVFDGLDGYVARLARTTSDFGAELDSLCDVVSFGVAPGVSDGEDVPAVHAGARPDGLDHCGGATRPVRRCGWRGSTSRPATTTNTCISAVCPVRRRRRSSPASPSCFTNFARILDPPLEGNRGYAGCNTCCLSSACW